MKYCQSVDSCLKYDAVICDVIETTVKANLTFVESVEKLISIANLKTENISKHFKEEICQRYSEMIIRIKEIISEWIGNDFSDSGFCVDRSYFFDDLKYPEIVMVVRQKLQEILECVFCLKDNINNKEENIKQLLESMFLCVKMG